MPHPIRALFVGVFSLATGLVVAFLVSTIEIATDVALYGFSAAVVIPVGAIGCGLVAALGFYAASLALNVRPEGATLAIPLVSAVGAFFASHWFTFSQYELPTGLTYREVFALDRLGFVDYLHQVATESSLTLGSASSAATISRLGSWGYGVVMIEIIGFALGGWFVATLLRSKPWCSDSHRFMQKRGTHVSYFSDPERFEATANHLVDVLERGGAVAAFDYAGVARSTVKSKRKARFHLKTEHFGCPACGSTHTVISTQQKANNNWVRVSQTPLQPLASSGAERQHQLTS